MKIDPRQQACVKKDGEVLSRGSRNALECVDVVTRNLRRRSRPLH